MPQLDELPLPEGDPIQVKIEFYGETMLLAYTSMNRADAQHLKDFIEGNAQEFELRDRRGDVEPALELLKRFLEGLETGNDVYVAEGALKTVRRWAGFKDDPPE